MRSFLAIICTCFCASFTVAIEVTDGSGRVFDFEKPPRTVALAPVVNDLIFELGAENNLIAVSAFSDTRGKNIKKIGSAYGLDWEMLIKLKPELVICSYLNDDSLRTRFERCGIRYLCLHKEGLVNIVKDIRLLGAIFFKQSNAEILAKKFEDSIKQNSNYPKLRAFFLTGSVVAGHGSFVSDVLHVAGFENCAEKISIPWPVPSREFIVRENPDVLFFTAYDEDSKRDMFNKIRSDSAWRATNAVKNNRIYFVPFNDIILPSFRVVNAIEFIRKTRGTMK